MACRKERRGVALMVYKAPVSGPVLSFGMSFVLFVFLTAYITRQNAAATTPTIKAAMKALQAARVMTTTMRKKLAILWAVDQEHPPLSDMLGVAISHNRGKGRVKSSAGDWQVKVAAGVVMHEYSRPLGYKQ